jgi:hypothetical protein
MTAQSFLENFQLPKDFAKVPLVLIAMNFQLAMAGGSLSKLRKQLFNQAFMEKHFGELHKNELK